MVSGYSVNGFGDSLISRDNGGTSGFETLTQGNQTGWTLGFEMNMPFGLRSANAQVRNLELRLARAREGLATQEHEISLELASTTQSLAEHYTVARANYGRRLAAQTRYEKLQYELEEGTITPDPVVRAQASLAQAESAFHRSLADYNKELANFNLRKGTLLETYNVVLSEGPWNPGAYAEADRRARARTYAKHNALLRTEPLEFALPISSAAILGPGLQRAVPANDLPPERKSKLLQPVSPDVTAADTVSWLGKSAGRRSGGDRETQLPSYDRLPAAEATDDTRATATTMQLIPMPVVLPVLRGSDGARRSAASDKPFSETLPDSRIIHASAEIPVEDRSTQLPVVRPDPRSRKSTRESDTNGNRRSSPARLLPPAT